MLPYFSKSLFGTYLKGGVIYCVSACTVIVWLLSTRLSARPGTRAELFIFHGSFRQRGLISLLRVNETDLSLVFGLLQVGV